MNRIILTVLDISALIGVAISFMAYTLPAVQWTSAILASAWIIYQFFKAHKPDGRK